MKRIAKESWLEQRWKNGLGVTHEIVRVPTQGEFALRLSVATIEGAQPFSLFAGYTRAIIPLVDSTLTLVVDGESFAMKASEPLYFSGDATTATAGIGVAVDLNVIARGFVTRKITALQFAAKTDLWLFALSDGVVRCDGSEFTITKHETLYGAATYVSSSAPVIAVWPSDSQLLAD